MAANLRVVGLDEQQKVLRRRGIGGSEIGAIAGLNPHMTRLDVFRAKVEGFTPEISFHMERGIFLEQGMIDWHAHRTGATIRKVGTVVHPRIVVHGDKIVLCTPDALSKEADKMEVDLSVKVPWAFPKESWGAPGTDEVPEPYLAQVQWELIVLKELYGITTAELVAPLRGNLTTYVIQADAELQGFLLERARQFWRDHVLPKIPPPVDGTESCSEWLNDRFQQSNADIIPATAKANEWANLLCQARKTRQGAELAEREAVNHLKSLIGEHKGVAGQGWRATWYTIKGKLQHDWHAVWAEVKHLIPPNVQLEVLSKHTKQGANGRGFRPTFYEDFSEE